MTLVGFDFGTTNSLLSVVRGGRVTTFLEDGLPIPSVVCYEGQRVIVGRDARLRLEGAGLGVKGNTVRSPKTLLDRGSVHVDGVERRPVDIVADVVRHVVQTARSGPLGRDLGQVGDAVVTIPVTMEGRRRAALRDAFRLAGVRIQQFIHEPLAALYGHLRSLGSAEELTRQYDRQLMLVVDWGGGTLDVTLCRLVNGTLFQIANDGSDLVGGDLFDEAVRNEVLDRATRRSRMDDSAVNPDARIRLQHKCEEAKIALSTKDRVKIYVPSFSRIDQGDGLDETLTRDELQAIVAPLLDQGFRRIACLLERAGVSPAQISMCLAVGGMANMPAIRMRLHEWFGVQRVHVSQRTASLISEGAAWIAHDGTPLCLAKDIEVVLARNTRLAFIRAGTTMPVEGEVRSAEQLQLYCVDPRDGHAKIQLESPVTPGQGAITGDPRIPLCTIEVKVDTKAKPFHERLLLQLAIDDDLILRANAVSLNQRDMAESHVHDLEFSVRIPGAPAAVTTKAGDGHDGLPRGVLHQAGDVALRSNIADREDKGLVPGELLYSYDREYFDRRMNPPEVQDIERLYYAPCSICGRPSNHPDCHCGATLNSASQPRR